MPRSRFHKLPPLQQQSILRAALDEFATHGWSAGSLNRIIETAGISKGSMYYYFDGKDDLYVHVVRVELGRLIERAGPFPIPSDRTPDTFWSTLERYYVSLMVTLASSPQLAALVRDWLTASRSPALWEAQREMEQASLPWFEQTIVVGQRARAVRKDIPTDLLIAIAFGMGQAMDTWLLMQRFDDKSLRKLTRTLVGMIRRALEP